MASSLLEVKLPLVGHSAFFMKRELMRVGHPTRSFCMPFTLPAVTLPIDWTKNWTLSFPIDGNDRYGDCLYAAAVHADNTFTGNSGTESSFNEQTIINDYLTLSGGDNGLNEGEIIGEWKNGLASTPAANIVDSLDIDPTNVNLAQSAIDLFGGIIFMLSVPDKWINNFTQGVIWDGPATPDDNNGHGVWWNGVNTNGNYRLITWGSYCWITPKGVTQCNPSAFIVFSTRWFNSSGYAPNSLHITTLASLWQQCGGNAIPASIINSFPPPNTPPTPPGPNPPNPPTPPTPGTMQTIALSGFGSSDGTYQVVPVATGQVVNWSDVVSSAQALTSAISPLVPKKSIMDLIVDRLTSQKVLLN